MRESDRLLLNIKAAHKQIIQIGKMNLEPQEKARILHGLQREIKGYEAQYYLIKPKELKQQNEQTADL